MKLIMKEYHVLKKKEQSRDVLINIGVSSVFSEPVDCMLNEVVRSKNTV